MILEVIAYTLGDAKVAHAAGADRIEIITAPAEGGLTPSRGLVEEIREHSSIDMRIMVRPHSRHFCYDADDVQTIVRDAKLFNGLGIDGFVFGALTPERRVDEELLNRFIEAAGGLPITFHRAFDEVLDQEEALMTLSRFPQVTHVLTSGAKPSAAEAVDTLRQLQHLATHAGHLRIIAGAGLTVDILADFIQRSGVSEVHMGSGVRVNNHILQPLDASSISEARGWVHRSR
ncbi:copper homeostasis protein CutC [Paenibacillus sp. YPG26]|uniref:copper homeostasis protein CutC n=1 Tax=Paenibacillus sp. YPG26 TaxID=2878915 RepID=UPI0020404C6F|nr:copper homeostasis protein CutC [Paenibacillus sp. YPG26]USB32879.1 copper homeostasis protein CutC [Paenibacillus sp. YPG26]